MNAKRLIAIPLVFVLMLAGCKPSTVVSTLGSIITSAEIALPVIGAATGTSPQTITAIVKYLQTVDAAVSQASTILAGPGTSAEKSVQIVHAFAAIANGCNCVPAGTPTQIVAVVDAVAQAVGRFLANFPSTNATPQGVAAAAPVPEIKVTGTDQAELIKIRTRAEQNSANLKGLKQ